MRGRRFLLIAVAFVAVGISGCAANLDGFAALEEQRGPTEAARERLERRDPLKLAIVVPTQGFGRAQLIGKGLKQAAEMALFDANDPNVQLIAKNEDGSAEGLAAATQEALSGGAEMVVGPLFGASVPRMAPLTRAAGVPLMTFSNDRSIAGSGVYLMSVLPEREVETVIGYALDKGMKTFAALIPAGAYGDTVEQTFRTVVGSGSGLVVALERYDPGTNAMLDPARRIFELVAESGRMGSPIDAVFLPATPESLSILASQMGMAGVDPARTKVLGIGGWTDPNLGKDKMLMGAWYPGVDPRAWDEFAERFGRTFGSAPPRIAIHAYDAVRMAIALAAVPKGQRFSQARLTTPEGFDGAAGRFRLLPDGTSQRELAVLEVLSYGSRVLEKGRVADQAPIDRAGGRAGGSRRTAVDAKDPAHPVGKSIVGAGNPASLVPSPTAQTGEPARL